MLLRTIRKTISYHKRTVVTSLYPDINYKKETIAEAFFTYCQRFSNRIAFIDYDRKRSYTYSDFEKSVKAITSSLTKKHIRQGSLVGIVATNCAEYLMLKTAITSMGCIVMLCNPNFTKREITDWLINSKSTILFITEDVIEKVSQAASEVSDIKDIYLIGNRKPGFKSVDDLMNDSGNMNPIGHLNLDVDNDIASVIYSSGTTGVSKGIMLTHTNLVNNLHHFDYADTLGYNMTMLLAMPMYHLYGVVVIPAMSFVSGSTAVILPKLEYTNALHVIEKLKINLLHVVPPFIRFLINDPQVSNYDLSHITKCITGGSPLDKLTKQRFVDKFRTYNPNFEIHEIYGSTECLLLMTSLSNYNKLAGKEASVGMLTRNIQCKVVDVSSREEVFVHKPGELLIKGPTIMRGYHGMPIETEEAFENGWFKTDDFGYYDSDNYFYVTGRVKDIIAVNGLQVSPLELEEMLISIPGIIDCAVVGVPDEKYGKVPRAFIVRNKNINEKEINDFITKNLSLQKQLIGGIKFVSEIPKTPAGKIIRRLLKSH